MMPWCVCLCLSEFVTRHTVRAVVTIVVMAAARARGAVLGSLVADAAAVPVHWCYDPEKLAEHLKQAEHSRTNLADQENM